MDAADQLEAIAEVAALDIEVWLRGGWATDFFLGGNSILYAASWI